MALAFRSRLAVSYAASVALLLALSAGALLYTLNRMAEQKFDTALSILGATQTEAIVAEMRRRGLDRPDASVTPAAYAGRSSSGADVELYVTVLDEDLRVVARSPNLTTGLPVDPELAASALSGRPAFTTAPVSRVGTLRVAYVGAESDRSTRPFLVLVALPESFVAGSSQSFALMVAAAVATIVLLTAAFAMLLADRAIAPVEQIADAVEAVDAQHLSADLIEPGTDDPIGRLAAVFDRMLERLSATFEAQRQFVARAAHELRTPLTILKGETQVALARPRSPEEYRELLVSGLEEIGRLETTIDGLLVLARYEGGEARALDETVALGEIAGSIAHRLGALARERGVALDVRADEGRVVGDRLALERLVSNLLANALAYTRRGGRVTLRVASDVDSVLLAVDDTGIGIAPDELPHIFDRFFRSKAAQRTRPEGSGVGLAACAAIARLHGVSIDVSSTPGVGSRFEVRFGAATADRAAVPDAVDEPPVVATSGSELRSFSDKIFTRFSAVLHRSRLY